MLSLCRYVFLLGILPMLVGCLPSDNSATSPETLVAVSMLPPGSVLPSGESCAEQVQAQGQTFEHRELNIPYNQTIGHTLPTDFFNTPYANDTRANTEIASQVDGNFTGSTDEILRWAACKWGIDPDLVRALATNESWWRQRLRNNWTTHCPDRHPPGSDDVTRPDECHRDYGILQLNYEFFDAVWPGMADSTAMNVDTVLAVIRTCYEGYQLWLHNVAPPDRPYVAGDIWGCLGRYRSGGWYDTTAINYMHNVQNYLIERRWEQPYFDD